MRLPEAASGTVSNLYRDHLAEQPHCHDGQGSVSVFRPFQRSAGAPGVEFIDLVVIPPGASIGRHRHGDNVEWYVILSGSGSMWFAQQERRVEPGDILVNPPFGEHGLRNDSAAAIGLLVFQVSAAEAP